MKKLISEFKTPSEIRKLKTIMKNVYSSKSDHLPDITRFNLNKTFAPSLVEKAEIHITSSTGIDIVAIAKNSLTFFIGDYPFTKVNPNALEEEKYIILPWDLSTHLGQDNLKNLITRIKENTTNIKYIIFIRKDNELDSSITSLAGLNLSNILAEDNTETLLSRIEELELRLKETNDKLVIAGNELVIEKQLTAQKQSEVNNLNNQLNTVNTQKSSLQDRLDSTNNNYNYYLQAYNSYYSKYNQAVSTTQAIRLDVTNTHSHNVVFGNIKDNLIEIQGVKITPATGGFTVGNIAL